jgi:hypothetical protein
MYATAVAVAAAAAPFMPFPAPAASTSILGASAWAPTRAGGSAARGAARSCTYRRSWLSG